MSPPPADERRSGPSFGDWGLLLAASVPLLYAPVFLAVLFSTAGDDELSEWFLVATVAVILYSWLVVAKVIVDAVRNNQLDEPRRIAWILAAALFSGLAAPLYVWKYRFRTRGSASASDESSPGGQ